MWMVRPRLFAFVVVLARRLAVEGTGAGVDDARVMPSVVLKSQRTVLLFNDINHVWW
jgi:hypothetical protein